MQLQFRHLHHPLRSEDQNDHAHAAQRLERKRRAQQLKLLRQWNRCEVVALLLGHSRQRFFQKMLGTCEWQNEFGAIPLESSRTLGCRSISLSTELELAYLQPQ